MRSRDQHKLTLDDYQDGALSTAIFPPEYAIIYPVLKLTGEAGEVAEKIGKVLRDKGGEFDYATKADLMRELGDVLWYIAALANGLGFNLSEGGGANLAKLADRANRGVLKGSGDNR